MMKLYRARIEKRLPCAVLADVLMQTGGAYETTTPLTGKFREYIREVAELTSDELLRMAELPEAPVSLEIAASWTRKPALSCSAVSTSVRRRPRDGGGSRPPAGLGTNHARLPLEEDRTRLGMRILRAGNCG